MLIGIVTARCSSRYLPDGYHRGVGFALLTDFWPLLLIAVVGTLNPSSGDVSVFLPLEHAMLSRLVHDKRRTTVFAHYSLVGSLLAALGSLAAALPAMLGGALGLSDRTAMQAMFLLYALLAAIAAWVYRGLPRGLSSADGCTDSKLQCDGDCSPRRETGSR